MEWSHEARVPLSWQRSCPLVFDRADNAPLSDSEQTSDVAGFSDRDSLFGPSEDARSREYTVWRYLRCDSESYDWMSDSSEWKCRICQGTYFYDSLQPTRRETPEGCWTYVPRSSPSPPSSPPGHSPIHFDISSTQKQNEPNQHSPNGPPSDDAGSGSYHETAESETLTTDPSVDPETGLPLNRRRRRQRRNAGRRAADGREPEVTTPPGLPTPDVAADGQVLAALRQLLAEQKKGRSDSSVRSDQTYDSRKGPAPGIKFRGGTPPAPPQWRGSSQDLRAFARSERRIEVWKLQIKAYMPDSDAALSLFTSLSGEAEAEIEHLDLKRVHHKDGIAYIMESLREPLQQKQLFQKRNC